jgi:hypothetical protein
MSFRLQGVTPAWPGEQMNVTIRQEGDGSRLVVRGVPTAAYRLEMAEWHRAKAIGLMFLDRLKIVLPNVPEPEPVAAATRSVADELESLAHLRDRGDLTEDEFQEAKKKLLS